MIKRVSSVLDGFKDELFKMALDLHENPELGLQEFKACAFQKKVLENHGFTFEMPYCDFDTAYKASYYGKKPGPNIAYIAQYDALAGLGHACGHNLGAMTACGAGIALREFVDEFGGNVFVFGTPAEETIGGKCIMAAKGVFDDMDACMLSHTGADFTSSGTSAALNGYRFEFFGKPAHSASSPAMGINALDAAINTFNMVNALRQHIQDSARIHGIIEKGGDAANIVPKYASVLMEVRSPDRKYHAELCEKVLNCARAAAKGAGARLEISHYEEFFDVLLTNRTLARTHDDLILALGVDHVEPARTEGFASSDSANISQRCPLIQPTFKFTDVLPSPITHSQEYAEETGKLPACEYALISAKAMASTGLKLLTEPELLAEMKAEFAAAAKSNAIG